MKFYFLFLITLASTLTYGQPMKDLNHKDKIKFFFDHLSKDNLSLVDDFYHPGVKFIDPIGTIDSSEGIKKYYENMYKNVKFIKFDFSEFHEAGTNIVAVWKMTLQADKLNGGEPITVDGNSVITFDESGKATYHRDYFDMGQFIYEHIPVVGYVIKKIKNRLKAE